MTSPAFLVYELFAPSKILFQGPQPLKLCDFMPQPLKFYVIRSKIKSLLCPQHFLQYKSMGTIFDAQHAQGHVTLKRVVRSGPIWNSSKILCLSQLSASLKKIRSKLKVLSCPQHFFWHSRAGNSEVNGRNSNSTVNNLIWPDFELLRDCIPVLVICRFEEIRSRFKTL